MRGTWSGIGAGVGVGWILFAAACAAPADPADEAPTETDACARPPMDLVWSQRTTGHEQLVGSYTVPWSGEERPLVAELWYPTAATEGDWATYMGAFQDPYAFSGAPFEDPDPACLLPLVVYSHGSQSWGGSAATLARHLVAQGWVAAAPDHAGNLLVGGEGPHPPSFSLLRVEDLRRTIDAVQALPPGHPLAGRVDTDHVFVLGHSFGAQTAWLMTGPDYDEGAIQAACDASLAPCDPGAVDAFAAAEGDPRVAAAMPLDGFVAPELVAASGWASRTPPVFAQSREGDAYADMFTRAEAPGVTWTSIRGSCHESFTGNPFPCPDLDKDEGLGIVGTYLSAFAAWSILGDDRDEVVEVLDGTRVVSDLVVMRRGQ